MTKNRDQRVQGNAKKASVKIEKLPGASSESSVMLTRKNTNANVNKYLAGLNKEEKLFDEDDVKRALRAMDGHGKKKKMTMKSEMQRIVHMYVTSKQFSGLIFSIILLNTILMILQTFQTIDIYAGWYLGAVDNVFVSIYIYELLLKLFAFRKSFFDDGWNVLDFSIVLFNVTSLVLPLILNNVAGFQGTSIFRLLRIFRTIRAIRAMRVLRTIRFMSSIQIIVTTLLQSIRSIGAIVSLMGIFMFIFAVIGREIFDKAAPDYFGRLIDCIFTTFQLLTLDEWYTIYELGVKNGYRISMFTYLLLFFIIEYFIFLNLFVAVLVDNFQLALESESQKRQKRRAVEAEKVDSDYYLFESSSSDDDFSDEDAKTFMGEHYTHFDKKEQELLRRHFMCLASIEKERALAEELERIASEATVADA